jgi:hypothetical protein
VRVDVFDVDVADQAAVARQASHQVLAAAQDVACVRVEPDPQRRDPL